MMKLYDWEYGGGDPMDPNNYVEKAIFMDDTTDNFTPGNDQGRVRVAKLLLETLTTMGAVILFLPQQVLQLINLTYI